VEAAVEPEEENNDAGVPLGEVPTVDTLFCDDASS
jgi:hypothetical protein